MIFSFIPKPTLFNSKDEEVQVKEADYLIIGNIKVKSDGTREIKRPDGSWAPFEFMTK